MNSFSFVELSLAGALGLCLLAATIRALRRDSLLDLLLALDLMALSLMGTLALFMSHTQSPHALELLMLLCLVGFMSSLFFIWYLESHPQKEKT